MRLGIAIPRATAITATWTTIHLARTALARGHSVRFIEPWDYEVDQHARVIARAHSFDPGEISAEEMVSALHQRRAQRRFVDLSQIDILLLRVAPLSLGILTFASLIRDRGVSVINDPDGVMAVSHKSWLAALPGVPTPLTLVTRSRAAAHVFVEELRSGAVVKPARGSGGRGVARVRPRSDYGLDRAFDDARLRGDGFVVLQEYVEEADAGEKRLMWLDGKLIGGYLRTRAPGDFRHNLTRGGNAEALTITDADRALLAPLSPHLIGAGIRLAGLDVIGSKITEVNVLNPGGTFHADRLGGPSLANQILARLEAAPFYSGDPHGHAPPPEPKADPGHSLSR
ncbi:MAG: hypothetical protein JXX28_17395 [Deltaproteobacteria bacterium]|nr:hypothetical protein [Deltaproteobacteria bacterium]